ncbi:MAG TPA: PepSY domain-containing protein [Burkholderiaceae bacterium]|nr:PepSY domain-containing protein [Burkholderiaceae bacterium]
MSQPRKPWTARRIHLWVAIILAIPMTLMAVSGILIAMRSVTHIQVPMSWMGAEKAPERLPITAFTQTADGTTWIGNAQGLNAIQGDKVQVLEHFSGQEIVGAAALGSTATPIVATRMAIWAQVDGEWKAVRRGRVRQLVSLADGGVLAISGGRGEMADSKPFFTKDGENWQPYGPAMKANKLLPKLEDPKVALHQFMRELHSGAFFFGKGPGEMAWSNVMGWVLVLLSLTGLWMWVKRELERRRAAMPSTVPAQAGGPAGTSASWPANTAVAHRTSLKG